MFSRQGIFAEGGSLAAGRDINIQYGLTVVPASFRARVQRFLSYYLGSKDRPVPFGGRGERLRQLGAWLANPHAPSNLLITAPAGRGKTALLVRWLQRVDPREWSIAFAPISIRFETNRPDIFYQALAMRLAEILEKDIQEVKGDAAAVYKDIVIEQLDAFADSGKRCLLVIDGLDEATGWHLDTSVLPPDPVRGLRIVVAARELAGDAGAQNWLRRLGWRASETCSLEVPPLDRAGVSEVLLNMGVPLADLAGDVDLLGELGRLTEGDPLLLRFYVEDLWENRHQAAGLRPEDLGRREAGFGAYFNDWLAKQGGIHLGQGAAFDEQTIKAVLAVLACALGPLRLADLVHLVRRLLSSERIISRDSLEPIQRFLIGGPGAGGYALGHPKLGEYLRDDFFGGSEDVARAREALEVWGVTTVRRLNAGELEPEKAPPYLVQFYAQHLKEANAGPDKFLELVEDGWCQAWEAYEGGLRGFANDVQTLLDRLRGAALNRGPLLEQGFGLGAQIRCVLCLSSIRSIGANVPAALLAELVRHHQLSAPHALHFTELQDDLDKAQSVAAIAPHLSPPLVTEALGAARAIRVAWLRCETLTALAPHLPPEERTAVLSEALGHARAIRVDETRAEALAGLAPLLPTEERTAVLDEALEAASAPDWFESSSATVLIALAPSLPSALLGKALEAARTIQNEGSRAVALAGLVPHLPPDQRPTVLTEALEAARAVPLAGYRARALAALAALLPRPFLAEALEAARAVGLEWPRTEALAALAPYLPAEERTALLAEALEAARACGHTEQRARALAALAPHLLAGERTAVLAEGLEVTRGLGYGRQRTEALGDLAPHLSPSLLAEAFAVARAIGDEEPRSRGLAALAEHLPPGEQPAVLAEALKAARAIEEVAERAVALATLAPRLPRDERAAALSEALEAARATYDESNRAEALTALAAQMPLEERNCLLVEALAAVRAIADETEQTEALATLAPHMPSGKRPAVLAEALAKAFAIQDEEVRSETLAALAPHLPPALLSEAFTVGRAIAHEPQRTKTLAALAPHLPAAERPAILAEALAAARVIEDEEHRSQALAALVPHLTPGQRPAVLAEALGAVRAARGIDGVGRRAGTVAALSLHLPPRERPALLAEAFEFARAVVFEQFRVSAVAGLVPHLPPALLPPALDLLLVSCARLRRPEAIRELVRAVIGIADLKQPGAEATVREMVAAVIEVGRRWP